MNTIYDDDPAAVRETHHSDAQEILRRLKAFADRRKADRPIVDEIDDERAKALARACARNTCRDRR